MGQRAALALLGMISHKEIVDSDWEERVRFHREFIEGFLESDNPEEYIAQALAHRAITPGGARLARKLYGEAHDQKEG